MPEQSRQTLEELLLKSALLILNGLQYFCYAFAIFNTLKLFRIARPIPETSPNVANITSAKHLDDILASNTHVIVDFYANWCSPCRTIAPVFSQLANDHVRCGHFAFVKVNVDRFIAVAKLYDVATVPNFIVFKNGVPSGLAIKDVQIRKSMKIGEGGLVERINAPDKEALKLEVEALAK